MTEVDQAAAVLIKHGYGVVVVKVQDHKVVNIKVELDFNIAKGEQVKLP